MSHLIYKIWAEYIPHFSATIFDVAIVYHLDDIVKQLQKMFWNISNGVLVLSLLARALKFKARKMEEKPQKYRKIVLIFILSLKKYIYNTLTIYIPFYLYFIITIQKYKSLSRSI